MDIYSLGAVAYYLLTGQPIFDPCGDLDLLYSIAREQPPKPSTVSTRSVPAELEALILQCLAKDPDDRPATVFEVVERLASMSDVDRWTAADATGRWAQELAHRVA